MTERKKQNLFHFAAKESFFLISQRGDERVIQGKPDGYVEMWTRNESDPTQLWVASDYGQQLINVGTNLPLQAGQGKSWILDKESMVLVDARDTNKAMTRAWTMEDGATVTTYTNRSSIVQKFVAKKV